MQKRFCDGFNDRMRDELLNQSLFFGLDHARAKLDTGGDEYNHLRQHSAFDYVTTAACVVNLAATCDRLRPLR